MAKASTADANTGRAAQAKVKAAPPPAAVSKKAKTVAAAPNKKVVGKKAPVKTAAPKMASAPKKGATAKRPTSKKASAAKASTPKMAATSKAPATKKAAAMGKAPVAQTSAAKKAGPRVIAPMTAARAKTVAKTTGRKTAATKPAAKTVAVKNAAPRRPVVRTAIPTPAARRGGSASAARKAPPATPIKATAATASEAITAAGKLGGGAPQVFTVSHLKEADFKADGLRPYAQYRDLGIAVATGGLCQAHVIRLVPPCTDEVRKRHLHQADLQLVYVLKGWMKNEFEGHGEQMMSAGSCWLQPSGIKHTVLDYSPDCEVLEVIVPADFKTEELT